jgi:hypothetical protein
LPSGATIRGMWVIREPDTIDASTDGYGAVSFGYRLPSTPAPHIIGFGEPTPAGCSGDVRNPGAAPGHLCIFQYQSTNVALINGVELRPHGTLLFARSNGGGTFTAWGSWAVTAP